MRWRRLVDDLPVAVVAVSPPGDRISYLNDRAVAAFGRRRHDLLGTPLMSHLSVDEWDELIPRDQLASWSLVQLAAEERNEPTADRHAMVIRRPDGSSVPVVMTRLPLGRAFDTGEESDVASDVASGTVTSARDGRRPTCTGTSASVAYVLQDGVDGDLLRQQLQLLLAHSPVSFALMDRDGRVLIGGGGEAPAAVAGLAEAAVSSVFDTFANEAEIIELLRTAVSGCGVALITDAFGGQIDVTLAPLADPRGEVTRVVGVGVDVTARERARARQADVARFAHQALEIADSATLWRLAARTLAASLRAHVSLWDVGAETPAAHTASGPGLDPPVAWTSRMAAHLSGTGNVPAAGDIRYPSVLLGWQTLLVGVGRGSQPERVIVVQRPDSAGEPTYGEDDEQHVRAIADVLGSAAARLAAERQLRHRSLHDDLTGLANRAALLGHLDRVLGALHDKDRRVAVMFLDLDGFKAINDAYGHTAGDDVLRAIAERLPGAVRPHDLVGRLGGDEFAVVCSGVGDCDEMERLAHRVIVRLGQAIAVDGVAHAVTISAGVAISGAGLTNPDRLLNASDIAMYKAKRAGGGQCVVYQPWMGLENGRKESG
ncbi:diguanylate cyclase [Frankia sp. CNm7]|uniref:Diguanylate cyclase n=1 Tax=Frankia nepalensis TaxID=1836974 RepID=A0A937RG12_9ACTN|nr:diguanylate cyclase [Frankia nepalensis]MBL7499378.1 diguanylate cyclase [Frankia nepalensis]MBL7512807.1 diguanylate cyclase [Frankia nepalensis]MBL7521792.1 diguanylate cyclase [Frankia nepalensis]MBL7631521.1 diguanylate cyclase [Frankia nepalensis]